MCFIHFKISINVEVMPKMYILLTVNLPFLSRVRRKQQIKERPATNHALMNDPVQSNHLSMYIFHLIIEVIKLKI